MIGWLDCSSGASGDMLLGALVDAGVDLELLQAAVDAVTPEPVRLTASRVVRGGVAATKVNVEGTESTVHRTFADIRSMLGSAPRQATSVFSALASAEARVH